MSRGYVFAAWLPSQRRRDDRVGELVRYLERDRLWRWPLKLSEFDIDMQLRARDAPPSIRRNLEIAVEAFERENFGDRSANFRIVDIGERVLRNLERIESTLERLEVRLNDTKD